MWLKRDCSVKFWIGLDFTFNTGLVRWYTASAITIKHTIRLQMKLGTQFDGKWQRDQQNEKLAGKLIRLRLLS